MKELLVQIAKIGLILMLVLLAVLLVFGLVLLIGWPWWVGFFVMVGLVGVLFGILMIRKIWARRREQMFVHQIIQQDESMRQSMAPKDQDTARELQARWKEAVDALRHSHLRKFGNPLYVLPWYMVIGESGSGKTTAIKSARLSSPFAEMSRTSGISGTRNCDWWFFEQAILIDTAGRYAIPVDEGRDKDEWQKFLKLLVKFRKKEPLNGLVVTVAADRLTQSSPETLAKDGVSIRQRIEELMRVLGARFPVYVLVTKCDLIQGATQFCNSLPEETLNQAMGLVNKQLSGNADEIAQRTFSDVGNRLQDLRLILLHKTKETQTAADMLLFPEEFGKLKDALAAFIKGAFQENPYQETPLLRGLFFSSGRQEGTPFSHFLNALGLIQHGEMLGGTNKGLFLHDFFARILPVDRNLFRPTQHMQQWRILTRNMGLTAWIAIMVAVCGLLSYAFVKNLSALSDVRREFSKPAVLQGELMADVITMDRFRQALIKAENGNRNWWIPRLGLNESLKVETELKQKYIKLFQTGFLKDFDKAMADRMTHFSGRTPSPVFGVHVAHLVRRINLLKARLADEDLETLEGRKQPSYSEALFDGEEMIPEIEDNISGQYLYTVAWQKDSEQLNNELTNLQTWLKHLLTLPDIDMNWLADWVNTDPSLAPVMLSDFWGSAPREGQADVPAAFTQAGKAKIDEAVSEIEAALFDPLIIAGQKLAFDKWYHAAYYQAWENFTREFPGGAALLENREQWQTVARRLPTENGPYYALIDRLLTEFDGFDDQTALPPWVELASDWQDVEQEAHKTESGGGLQKAGIIKKATRKVQSKMRKAEKAFGVKARKPLNAKDHLNAVGAYQAYYQALEETVKGADSPNVAFKLAADLYQQDPAIGESPFLAAHRSLQELKRIMSEAVTKEDDLFWALLYGNINFMQDYANREAACALQSRWEKDVLLEIQGVSADKDMTALMMGQGGYASEFIKGPAAPFIGRSLAKGYYPKRVMDMEIPFEKDFLAYLSKGARAAQPAKSSYRVKVRAYPTDTNKKAQMRPHSTVLELQCADGNTRLENLNYPVAKTFVWQPNGCGDVQFHIGVGNLTLTKTYTGAKAFAKFLHDFKTGQKTFQRSAFPSDEAALRRMGIKYIKVKYQFQGHKPVLGLLYAEPGRPPREIAACWGN